MNMYMIARSAKFYKGLDQNYSYTNVHNTNG